MFSTCCSFCHTPFQICRSPTKRSRVQCHFLKPARQALHNSPVCLLSLRHDRVRRLPSENTQVVIGSAGGCFRGIGEISCLFDGKCLNGAVGTFRGCRAIRRATSVVYESSVFESNALTISVWAGCSRHSPGAKHTSPIDANRALTSHIYFNRNGNNYVQER